MVRNCFFCNYAVLKEDFANSQKSPSDLKISFLRYKTRFFIDYCTKEEKRKFLSLGFLRYGCGEFSKIGEGSFYELDWAYVCIERNGKFIEKKDFFWFLLKIVADSEQKKTGRIETLPVISNR
jgi:hypothetical protein